MRMQTRQPDRKDSACADHLPTHLHVLSRRLSTPLFLESMLTCAIRDRVDDTASPYSGVWVSKATEFAQLINTGAEGAEVPIPLHVFALKGSVDGEGFYKPCADWWASATTLLHVEICNLGY